MTEINLRTIFRALGAESVLQQETRSKDTVPPSRQPRSFQRYTSLSIGERASVSTLDSLGKTLLPSNHYRLGVLQTKLSSGDASFGSSLICGLHDPSMTNHSQLAHALEQYQEYVTHSLSQNSGVDKTKNTRRVQRANAELAKQFSSGECSPELIQRLAELEEINIFVLDIYRHEARLYWSHGVTHPHLNIFRPLLVLVFLGDVYEPVICPCADQKKCSRELICRIIAEVSLTGEQPTITPISFLAMCEYASHLPCWITLVERYGKPAPFTPLLPPAES